ncbi:hypothetical protein [Streptomyces sp. SAS_270]|uniref:hypothetical protein n=1 Tax=Streptomyces sp. SAS_270 TaxID=3412748 RepID=UPI00403C813F
MRVLLSAYGSRGDVEPLVGPAMRLREVGAEVPVCVPPDEVFAKLSAPKPLLDVAGRERPPVSA